MVTTTAGLGRNAATQRRLWDLGLLTLVVVAATVAVAHPLWNHGGVPPWLPVAANVDDWTYLFWTTGYAHHELIFTKPVIAGGASLHSAEAVTFVYCLLGWLLQIDDVDFPSAVRVMSLLATGFAGYYAARAWLPRTWSLAAAALLVAGPFVYWGKPFFGIFRALMGDLSGASLQSARLYSCCSVPFFGSPDIRVGENDDGSWVGEGRLDGGGRRET